MNHEYDVEIVSWYCPFKMWSQSLIFYEWLIYRMHSGSQLHDIDSWQKYDMVKICFQTE